MAPCGHSSCLTCLKIWFNSEPLTRTCPLCRAVVEGRPVASWDLKTFVAELDLGKVGPEPENELGSLFRDVIRCRICRLEFRDLRVACSDCYDGEPDLDQNEGIGIRELLQSLHPFTRCCLALAKQTFRIWNWCASDYSAY